VSDGGDELLTRRRVSPELLQASGYRPWKLLMNHPTADE
jgi:hypothetical protein